MQNNEVSFFLCLPLHHHHHHLLPLPLLLLLLLPLLFLLLLLLLLLLLVGIVFQRLGVAFIVIGDLSKSGALVLIVWAN